VDEFDLKVLIEISRERLFLWGNLDPRLSAETIAKRLRTNRNKVWSRLRGWERCGFLRGWEVTPSLALFGAGLGVTAIRVDDGRKRTQALKDIGLVHGVVNALEYVGPWIGVSFVTESATAASRRLALLSRLNGVDEVLPAFDLPIPECSLEPTALEWRVLESLRRWPRGTLAYAARHVGVSQKTFTKHYDRLIKAKAIWCVPLLDFTCYGEGAMARLLVTHSPGASEGQVSTGLARHFPTILDNLPVSLPGPPPRKLSAVLIHLRSAAEAEEAHRTALTLPGVEDVEVLFPKRIHLYRDWFDERIGEALARATAR